MYKVAHDYYFFTLQNFFENKFETFFLIKMSTVIMFYRIFSILNIFIIKYLL